MLCFLENLVPNYDIETNIDFNVNRFQIEDVNFLAQKNANLDLILKYTITLLI